MSDIDDGEHQDYSDQEEIANERLETKRKTFFLDLKRNERGLFIKISERSGGRRSTVMLPYENVDEFITKIQALRAAGPDPDSVAADSVTADADSTDLA